METKAARFLNWLSTSCLYLVVFLLPLFFLPFTVEKYELNKYYLFYFLILAAFLSYLGRAVIRKKFEIKRTVLDIPLLVLWAICFVSTLFSADRFLSIFGDFSFLSFSFISFTAFLLFFFLVTQQINNVKQVLKIVYTFLLAGFISSLYFILQVLGFLNSLGLPLPAYNPVSSSNTAFGIFMVLIMILSWAFLTIRKRNFLMELFIFLVWITSLVSLVMIGFNIIWVILIIGLVVTLIFFFTSLEKTHTVGISVGLVLLVVALLFVLLGQPKFLTVKLPAEIAPGPNISWSLSYGTVTNGLKYFILGSGPATFAYDFSQFRSQTMNMNFVWNMRFNQSYSTVLEWMATNGIIFLLTFLGIILIVLGVMSGTWIRQILELKKKKNLVDEARMENFKLADSVLVFWALFGAWFLLAVSMFFINFSSVLWMSFWFLTAVVLTVGGVFSKFSSKVQEISLKTAPQYAFLTSFLFILAFTFVIVLIVYLGRFYTAEVIYANSLSEPVDQKILSLQDATNLNSNRVIFYLATAEAFVNKASDVANSTKDLNQISELLAAAVNSAKLATDKSPLNVASWEFLSNTYANARSLAPEANSWVISSLEKASSLEPTNPTFFTSLANAKLLEKRYGDARDDYERAISLKPDFLTAYVGLANLYEAQNKIDDSITTMQRGLTYGRQNPEYLFYLGRYYFNRNAKDDSGLAEIAFRSAIQINPNYSDALYALALLYEKNGLKQQAVVLYKRVQELNPTNTDIKSKIDVLSGVVALSATSTLPMALPDKK